jgi:hypothetical protein
MTYISDKTEKAINLISDYLKKTGLATTKNILRKKLDLII